jgi:integrase
VNDLTELSGARRGTGFHDLRHYYASLLIRHSESVKTVQHRLGHATAAETLDTYAHLWPDSEDRTRQAIDLQHRFPR